MLKPLFPTLLVAVTLLTGCSSVPAGVQTSVNSNPAAPFPKYKTYGWSPPAASIAALSPTSRSVLEGSLSSGLAIKGITLSNNPDFLIVYHVSTSDKSSVKEYNQWQYGPNKVNDGSGAPSFYTYGAFMGNEVKESQYMQGTLIVDFVDAKTRKSFWRGTSIGQVSTQKANSDEIATGVRQMLDQYPPK